MFSKVHVRVKNTFLDFHDLDGVADEVVATRARSAEPSRNYASSTGREAKELRHWRLNKLLPSVGVAKEARVPRAVQASFPVKENAVQNDTPSVQELRVLQRRLSEVCEQQTALEVCCNSKSQKQLFAPSVDTRVMYSRYQNVFEEVGIAFSTSTNDEIGHQMTMSKLSMSAFTDVSDWVDDSDSWMEFRRMSSSDSISTMTSDCQGRAFDSRGGWVGISSQPFGRACDPFAVKHPSLSLPFETPSTHSPLLEPILQLDACVEPNAEPPKVLPPGAAMPFPSESKSFKYSHVPKRFDFSKEYENVGTASAPTTLMIRNIPNRYTPKEVMKELDEMGLKGKYNFFYLPLDTGTMANLGYAFVNFASCVVAKQCMDAFLNYRFKRHRKLSTKVASVSPAHIQGLEANVAHYEKCAVNSARLKQCRPLVFAVVQEVGLYELDSEKTQTVMSDPTL